MNRHLLSILVLVLSIVACGDVTKAKPARPAEATSSLKTKTMHLAGQSLTVEIADTPETQSRGLMFREHMNENHGMLFVFSEEEPRSFWMKNTLIPLSIAYISAKGKIVDIQDMEPASPIERNPKTYPSSGPAQYALEVNKGWFRRHKIKAGDTVPLP